MFNRQDLISLHQKSFSFHSLTSIKLCFKCLSVPEGYLNSFYCASCSQFFCRTCIIKLEVNEKVHICVTCLEALNSNPSLSSESRKIVELKQEIIKSKCRKTSLKNKNKELLTILRELNLTYSKTVQCSNIAERTIENKLINKHEKNVNLEYLLQYLNEQKKMLTKQQLGISDQVEKLKTDVKEINSVIHKDTEKIIDLEDKIKEQLAENKKLEEMVKILTEKQELEGETCKSTEKLNTRLMSVRCQYEEAQASNQILKKKLTELQGFKYDDSHLRCFENRAESLKRMIEQFNDQDHELKELEHQLKVSPIESSSCKCNIM